MSYLGSRDLEVDYEPGAHPGWDDYWFTCNDRRFRLLVIRDASEPRSQISMESQPQVPQDNVIWPSWHILSLPCCITPETAYEIISTIFDKFEQGRLYGRSEKAREITKALSE